MSRKTSKEEKPVLVMEHHAKRWRDLIHPSSLVQGAKVVGYVLHLAVCRDSRLQPTYPQLQRPGGAIRAVAQHWKMVEAVRRNQAEYP